MLSFLKLGLISIVVGFLMFTAITFFIPSTITISRAINLPNKNNQVFLLLSKPANWKLFLPDADSASLFFENGNVTGVYWKYPTNKTMLLTSINSNFIYTKTFNYTSKYIIGGWQIIHSNSDSLTIQWFNTFKLSWYPWQKLAALGLEPTWGSYMQKGLLNLKHEVEK